MEDLAYRRLLDAYYLRESELPLCTIEVSRIISMRFNIEDVEQVLIEFFERTETGWFHKRAEAEIAHFRDKRQKASNAGKASAERRSNVRSTDVQPTNNHKPITKNQEPNITPLNPPKGKAVSIPSGVEIEVWNDFLELRKAKRAPLTKTALDGIEREAAKAGWTLNDALSETVARGWRAFKADWVKETNNGKANRTGSNVQRGSAGDGFTAVLREVGSRDDAFDAPYDDGRMQQAPRIGFSPTGRD